MILPILLAVAATQSCPAGVPIAFVDASILTMNSSTVTAPQTVLVANGRITAIGKPSLPERVCRVDALGKYLLPGLSDLHVHTDARELPLFLVNGVTLIREMNGSPMHIALRDSIAAGTRIGPRMLVASPLLVGTPLRYRHRLITSADDARAAAREAKDAGYDYLKIYDGLTTDQYAAFVDAGRTLALPLDGHIPVKVGLKTVIEAKQSIQHIDKILFAVGGMSADSSRLAEAVSLFAANPVWVTPTIASLRALDAAGTAEYAAALKRPEMAYMDSGSIAWWTSLRRDGTRAYTPSRVYNLEVTLLKMLKAANVPLLLGTDAANPLMVAGYSLHDEMEALLREGGFSLFEVLSMATRNAGVFLGDRTTGVIEVGARGDLLLVNENPLEKMATLRDPAGVVIGGRWLDRAALQAMRESVRR